MPVIHSQLPNRICLALLTLLAITTTGCLPKQSSDGDNSAEAKLPPLDILTFPSSDRLPLGQAMCSIQGGNSIPFISPYPGVIKLHVSQSKTTLEKGDIWGEMSAEEITNDIKSHLDQKNNLDLKQMHYDELEKPKEILQLQRELMKAKESLKNFELIYKEMNTEELNQLIPSANQLIELDPEAYDRAKKEVYLLQKALNQLENNEATPTELNFMKDRKQWDRKLHELERKKELSQFKAPFDGELTLSFPLFQDKDEYPVTNNQRIANLRSYEHLLVQVKSIDPRWLNIPEEELFITISNGTNEIIAHFHEKKLEDNRMKEEMVLYFKVSQEHTLAAKKLVGSSLTANIWKRLDQKAIIIPKFTILMHHPEISGTNWATEISNTFNDYKLLSEGDSSLALIQKN